MADKFNFRFTPDTIDEQIDLASQQSEQNPTSGDRIIKKLEQHYIPMQDHSQSLERVWNRFIDQRAPIETIPQNVRDQQPGVIRDMPDKRPVKISSVYTPLRRSGLAAAVIFLALIVGGMVMLPQLLHRSNQAQTNSVAATPTNPAIIGEEPIYNVIAADGGKAYLYKGIKPIKAGQSQAVSLSLQFKVQSGKLIEVNFQKGGTRIWSYKGDLFSAPILANDVLYVPSQSGLDALRASDHTLLWHQNILLTPYEVSNGTLYAFGQDAGLEALRASDGALLWHSQYKLAWIDNDIVYASERFDYINALRASDGALLWRSQLVDNDLSIENGVVLLRMNSDGVRALNGKTGALLWSNKHISTILAMQNGVVYALAKDGIAVLQANTGQIVWQYKASSVDGVWLDKNTVYVDTAQDNAHVLALHLNDGKLLWQAKVSGHMRLLRDGVLYLENITQGDHGTFLTLKASDGSLLWQRNDIDFLSDSPLQAQNGIVYIKLTDNKTIVALNASDGTTLARYSADAL